jgi:hypothetical protein
MTEDGNPAYGYLPWWTVGISMETKEEKGFKGKMREVT